VNREEKKINEMRLERREWKERKEKGRDVKRSEEKSRE